MDTGTPGSALFQRRRGRPRKEEQAMRDEITERLLHFLETNYDMYRTASRADFYQAAAEALGDVEPAEVKMVFEKLIDSYIESRRRRAQPGRERAIAHWFGRLDHLLAGNRDFGGLLGSASSAILAAGGPLMAGGTGSPTDGGHLPHHHHILYGDIMMGGAGGAGVSGGPGSGAGLAGRKRASTVLEAFMGAGPSAPGHHHHHHGGGVGRGGGSDGTGPDDVVDLTGGSGAGGVGMGGPAGGMVDYEDALSLGGPDGTGTAASTTGVASGAGGDGETHLAVQKAILRTHLAHLQVAQQALDLQRKQVELAQAQLDALREYRAQKLALLKGKAEH